MSRFFALLTFFMLSASFVFAGEENMEEDNVMLLDHSDTESLDMDNMAMTMNGENADHLDIAEDMQDSLSMDDTHPLDYASHIEDMSNDTISESEDGDLGSWDEMEEES